GSTRSPRSSSVGAEVAEEKHDLCRCGSHATRRLRDGRLDLDREPAIASDQGNVCRRAESHREHDASLASDLARALGEHVARLQRLPWGPAAPRCDPGLIRAERDDLDDTARSSHAGTRELDLVVLDGQVVRSWREPAFLLPGGA